MTEFVVSGGEQGNVVQIGNLYGSVVLGTPTAADPAGVDQLPAAQPLIDRLHERDRLGNWFGGVEHGDSPSVVVSGMEGVGKRTLVRHLAHAIASRFPEWRLHVDYGLSGGTRSEDPARALGHCLRALGMKDANQPSDLAGRRREFRRLCAGRRVLVLVENATTAAQLRMLAPRTPGCALLATSRRHLGELKLHHMRLLRLGPLELDAGVELLGELLDGPENFKAQRASAEAVVAYCGGLPLAIHLMASRLAMSPGLTVERLADELVDETGRLERLAATAPDDPYDREETATVSAPLELAYRDLTPEQREVYRVLGVLPSDCFDAPVVAAALDRAAASVQQQLDHLVRACALEAVGDGRYRVHTLVRLHARQHAEAVSSAEEPRRVVARVTRHYLVLVAFADRAVQRDRLRVARLDHLLDETADPFRGFGAEAGAVALAWLTRERASILAVLRDAARYGLHQLVWQLSEAFTILFLNDRHLLEWMESLDLGVDAVVAERATGDRRVEERLLLAAEARLRSLRSRPLMDLGRDDDAVRDLELAVLQAEEAGDPQVAASAQEFIGRYWERHDPERAVSVFGRAVELNQLAESPRGEAIARLFLGRALDAVGRSEEALPVLDQARGELLLLKDRRMAARALSAQGAARMHLRDLAVARRELAQAADDLKEVNSTAYEADTRRLLAEVLLELDGNAVGARRELLRAEEVYRSTGNPGAAQVEARLRELGE
ncbi:NB-ARC domain-containing protein [Streptacidiphilus sp. EB129]|uniref:NB-ARC domain-containing protein n=1 Tax=Streptacidiphilus sp. EB129 TaxID=3156262 RepID=UPI003519CB35